MPDSTPPLSFRALSQTAANPAAGGYPYQLKGDDLDRNFAYATEDFDTADFAITTTQSAGGHTQRRIALLLRIPTPPATGTHVLGTVDGVLTWIATEEC